MITLRPYQDKIVTDLKGSLARHKHSLVVLPTGGGKCLGKDTPVLMYDGAIKLVQDIIIGDKVMGPDSISRKVTSVCTGKENLYKITPEKGGDSFVCNESHILSFKMSGNCYPKNVNLTVADYLSKSKYFKHCAKLWRTGVDFKGNGKLKLSPYFLGLWLGDGTSLGTGITTKDEDIIFSIRDEAKRFGLFVRKCDSNNTRCPTYIMTTHTKGNPYNNVLEILREYNLISNKHIPMVYKTSSRFERLELLAGLIDSDGSLGNNVFDLIFKSEKLANDVAFLARSIGLCATVNKCKKTCANNGKVGEYHRICISGNISNVPCRLKRKQAAIRRQKKDPLVTGFEIKSLGEGDYYGFELSGPDRLFLLGDFTVTHNTILAAFVANNTRNKKKRVIFTCHRDFLLEQTAQAFDEFNIPYTFVAAGMTYNPYVNVVIASIDTLKRRLDKIEPPDLLFVDEAVHSAAAGWAKTIEYYQARGAYTIGLTGCPDRTSGQGLGNWFKDIVLGPSTGQLIEDGYLCRYKAYAPDRPDLSKVHIKAGDFNSIELNHAMDRPSITGNAVREYTKIAPGKQGIAFCCSIEHSQHVAQAFRDAGYRAAHIGADTPKQERAQLLRDFRAKRIEMLTSVDIFNEGFNVPSVQYIALLRPTKSLSIYLQQIGRGLRTEPGKDYAYISDHANNIAEFGLPDEDRKWSLDDRVKGKGGGSSDKTIKVFQCERCYYCAKPALICANCGHVREIKSREVEEIEGELTEIGRENMVSAQQRKAKSEYYKLVAMAKKRGYKNAEIWAKNVILARKKTGVV